MSIQRELPEEPPKPRNNKKKILRITKTTILISKRDIIHGINEFFTVIEQISFLS